MFCRLLILQYISIAILFIEAAYIFSKWRTRLQGILFFSCVATLVNNVGYLMEMLSNTQEEYVQGVKFAYLGKVWIPYSLLLFTLMLGRVNINKYLSMALAGLHVFTYAMVLTSDYHTLYYTGRIYEKDGIFPHVVFGHGIWHGIYTVMLLSYIVIGLTTLFRAAIREKTKIVRKRLFTVAASITVECLFYIVDAMHIVKGYDLTIPGYTLAAIIMCVAIFRFDLLDTLELAKEFVIDDVPEGIIVFNQNNEIEYTNGVAIGVFSEEIVNGTIRELLENALEDNETITKIDRIFSVKKRPLIHKDTDRGNVFVIVDETEHYRYMDELKIQKELAESAREEAIAASESKSAFLSVVSHEIRTPMNAVVGMTDLLLRDADQLSDKQEAYLRNIRNSGSSLVMIVNDILDQSKIEAGRMEIVEEAYELRPMVSDVRMIIENRIGGKPVRLEINIDDSIPDYLIGDSLRIRQILINLMNNAVKYTEVGYIRLDISRVDTVGEDIKVRFSIKDSGQGIKPEDMDRLGEAFAQVDTRKNHNKEGTGLGLSISKDFIAMMGGRLEVNSTYGQGSEFCFVIPQKIAKGIDNSAKAVKQAWQQDINFTCPKAKILVVDDTEVNLMVVEEMLKILEPATEMAASGEKAIELIKNNRYDVILMDYMMPYMDGTEATARIREMAHEAKMQGNNELAEYYRSVPVIALTADNSQSTKEKFIKSGINDFIEKPLELKQIKKLLLKLLPAEMINLQGK